MPPHHASPCWRQRLQTCKPCSGTSPAAREALALSQCRACGPPQRHEKCFGLVTRELHAHQRASFNAAQQAVHDRGGCLPPCHPAAFAGDKWETLLLGLSGFAAAGSAAHLGQSDVTAAWREGTRREALLREWVSLCRQRLEEGWRSAKACHARAVQARPPSARRFLLLSGGGEQMHKNRFVVMDALYIAHVLGRTLVEPRVRDARLASTNRSVAGSLALHHLWDLQPICERFDVLPARTYAQRFEAKRGGVVELGPKRGRDFPGGWRLHTPAAVRAAFRSAEGAAVLVLKGMWRSVVNDEITE